MRVHYGRQLKELSAARGEMTSRPLHPSTTGLSPDADPKITSDLYGIMAKIGAQPDRRRPGDVIHNNTYTESEYTHQVLGTHFFKFTWITRQH